MRKILAVALLQGARRVSGSLRRLTRTAEGEQMLRSLEDVEWIFVGEQGEEVSAADLALAVRQVKKRALQLPELIADEGTRNELERQVDEVLRLLGRLRGML